MASAEDDAADDERDADELVLAPADGRRSSSVVAWRPRGVAGGVSLETAARPPASPPTAGRRAGHRRGRSRRRGPPTRRTAWRSIGPSRLLLRRAPGGHDLVNGTKGVSAPPRHPAEQGLSAVSRSGRPTARHPSAAERDRRALPPSADCTPAVYCTAPPGPPAIVNRTMSESGSSVGHLSRIVAGSNVAADAANVLPGPRPAGRPRRRSPPTYTYGVTVVVAASATNRLTSCGRGVDLEVLLRAAELGLDGGDRRGDLVERRPRRPRRRHRRSSPPPPPAPRRPAPRRAASPAHASITTGTIIGRRVVRSLTNLPAARRTSRSSASTSRTPGRQRRLDRRGDRVARLVEQVLGLGRVDPAAGDDLGTDEHLAGLRCRR